MQHTSARPVADDENAFEQAPAPVNGKAPSAPADDIFQPVSRKLAEAAKKGDTSNSRTGKGQQVTIDLQRPPKNIFVKVHPNPDYHRYNLSVYQNPVTNSYHFVAPALLESGELPERFRSACKVVNIFTAACADGTFFLWVINVSATTWYKAAMKTAEMARNRWGIISSIRARNTYSFEAATEPIPDAQWSKLPAFTQLLLEAFDSVISVADDKVVLDFMSGGVANRQDEDEE